MWNWLKEKWDKVKTYWRRILIATGIVGVVLAAAPFQEVEMRWIHSYETLAFETADGDLGMDEYAIDPESNGEWYVRTIAKNEGQFVSTNNASLIQGKTEVSIRCKGCAYYSEFQKRNGSVIRIPYDKTEYNSLRHTRDYPQPKKTERINLLTSLNADAAIDYDTSTIDTHCTNCSSNTWSHTSTGSNLLLFITAVCADNDTGNWNGDEITYNSVSATNLARLVNNANNDDLEVFYLANPSTGANTASIGDSTAFLCDQLKGVATTFTGVDTGDPIDTFTTEVNSTANPSLDLTTTAANTWVVDFVTSHASFAALTADASQTARVDDEWGNGNRTGISTEVAASIGTYTMSWTLSTTHSLHIVASINQAAAPAAAGDAGVKVKGIIQVKDLLQVK